jgi:hypothetical protein
VNVREAKALRTASAVLVDRRPESLAKKSPLSIVKKVSLGWNSNVRLCVNANFGKMRDMAGLRRKCRGAFILAKSRAMIHALEMVWILRAEG